MTVEKTIRKIFVTGFCAMLFSGIFSEAGLCARGHRIKGIQCIGNVEGVTNEVSAGGSIRLGLEIDPGGATPTVKWSVRDAAGEDRTTEFLDDYASLSPVFSAPVKESGSAEVLKVQAETTDDAGEKSRAHIFIAVDTDGNHAPHAAITFSKSIGTGVAEIPPHFNCNAHDVEGDALSFCWDFNASDGIDPAHCDSTLQELNKTFSDPGIYEVTCIVFDSKGGMGFDRRTVDYRGDTVPGSVGGENTPPVITSYTVDFSRAAAESKVSLSAQADDPDGDEVEMKWNVSAGKVTPENSPVTVWELPQKEGDLEAAFIISDGTNPAVEHHLRFVVEKDGAGKVNEDSGIGQQIDVGVMPIFIISDPKRNLVFVSNTGSDEVSVIDAGKNYAVNTVKTGHIPWGLANNEEKGSVYIANKGDMTISVLDDSRSGRERETDPGIHSEPLDVAVDEEHDVYYVLYADRTGSGFVVPVNAISDMAGDGILISSNTVPSAAAINRVTRRLYVADASQGSVYVIDLWTNTVTATIDVDSAPADIEVNEKTNKVYVTCENSGKLVAIDGNLNSVVASVNIGFNDPRGIGIDETRNLIYVANNISGTVSVINGENTVRLKDIQAGHDPLDVAVLPGPNKIFVTRETAGIVSVLDGYNK